MMRSSNFTTATPDEVRELDRLASELRSSTRLRARVCGMRTIDALALILGETATKAGVR